MGKLAALITGVLFGVGVTVGGMVNPMKVLNFMDLSGQWDPTLIFVMGGALAVTFVGYRAVFARPAPLFAGQFAAPSTTAVDARLLAGAALFGLGWGLSGFCPGPAIASLAFGRAESFVFVIAMGAGIGMARILIRRRPSPRKAAETGG